MSLDPLTYVTITKLPRGEAPEEVRQAWVGLTLPAYPTYGYARSQGVVSAKETELREVVEVPQDGALAALMEHAPEAWRYWRMCGFPRSGGIFHFGTDEVEKGPGMRLAKISVWCDLERAWII